MPISKIQANSIADTSVYGRRNFFYNGDMTISQRYYDNAKSSAAHEYVIDEHKIIMNHDGAVTVQRVSTVPSGEGFKYSMKLSVATADTSLSSGQYALWDSHIEAQNLKSLRYGTNNAKTTVLSFWVRSSKTGTYCLNFHFSTINKQITKSYTIDTADTWEKKTVTVPGNTADAITHSHTQGLRVSFWLAAGSDFTSGSLRSTHTTTVGADRAVGQTNWLDSTSNDFYITGIQYELGDVASEYEFQDYSQQLARAQRYFFSYGYDPYDNDTDAQTHFGHGMMYSDSQVHSEIVHPVNMRIEPSLVFNTGTNYFRCYTDNTADSFDGFTHESNTSNVSSTEIYTSGTGFTLSGKSGNGALIRLDKDLGYYGQSDHGFIGLSAEM